jgi:3'-phosphoadenosine 5'-phosphosulfate sulfotransferase (PAPS reductase)/FAD synthetase
VSVTAVPQWSPYRLFGGALGTTDHVALHISGGRSSGYMLHEVVREYGGTLPPEIHPIFCNTGREMDETLDFVAEMSARWGVPIVWLERDFEAPEGFSIVGHNSAARHGQRTPFDDAIQRRRFLPNAVTRFCTTELKVRAATLYMQSLGLERWASVIGYRADEARRLKRAQKRSESGKDPFYTLAPMVDAGVTRGTVAAFWRRQSFDLRLPNINGKTPLGNCDLCFLKSARTLAGIARLYPDRAGWWTGHEAEAIGKTESPATATFRSPLRVTHTQIVDFVRRQGDLDDLPDRTEGIDCFCRAD